MHNTLRGPHGKRRSLTQENSQERLALDTLLTDRIGFHDPEDLTRGEVLSLLLDMQALYARMDDQALKREAQSGVLHYSSVQELVEDLNDKIDTFYGSNASMQRRLEQDDRVLSWLQQELGNVRSVLEHMRAVEEGFSSGAIKHVQDDTLKSMHRSMAGERGRLHGGLGGGVAGVYS
jgi:hypothetical protein